MSLILRADRCLIRAAARSRRYLCATVQAPDAPPRPGRVPVNLAFVIDRSGSMHGDKIARAREAVLHAVRSLREEDRFAVVAYDDQVELVVAQTAATPAARDAAARAVARIDARGSTDLAAGWRRGCEQVKEALSAEAVGRTILLTDGLANHGLTDHDEIVRLCTRWRDERVVTSAFGVGADFDETLLRRMADAGGGAFQFIESAVQIPDFVASEVGEALAVTAREAVLVLDAGGAEVESVNEFPCRFDGLRWRVELGSLHSGQTLEAIVRATFPEGTPGTHVHVGARVEDADKALAEARDTATFTRAAHEANDRQRRDREVDRRVAAAYAARAERDALERNRSRDFGGAREILERCAREVEAYAGDDAELQAIAEDLREKAGRYGRDMDAFTRKSYHSASSRRLKGRLLAGERVRGGARPVGLSIGPERARALDPVADLLRQADPDLFGSLHLDAGRASLGTGSSPVEPEEEWKLVDEVLANALPAAVHVLFVDRPLVDNWFSHWHPRRRAAVVSTAGWEETYGVPLGAFLAYEAVLHGLRRLGEAWNPERLIHSETRGCLFDGCAHKTDIDLKLQAGDLCPSCRLALAQAGAPLDRIERLAGVVRLLAAPSGVVH